MEIIRSIVIAFSMFSRIPVTHIEWNTGNMKYVMAAFPLVGAVCGGAALAWYSVCDILSIGSALRATGFIAASLIVTGGIHIDGFADTIDALSSRESREKKLEIMKDPHCGVFAIIGVCMYFLMLFSLYTEMVMSLQALICIFFMYMLSRALSGLCVCTFPLAKNSGLAYTFSDAASKMRVGSILIIEILLMCFVMTYIGKWSGVFVIISAFISATVYYFLCRRQFGGTTGDVAGWFLCAAEISMVFAIVLSQKIMI